MMENKSFTLPLSLIEQTPKDLQLSLQDGGEVQLKAKVYKSRDIIESLIIFGIVLVLFIAINMAFSNGVDSPFTILQVVLLVIVGVVAFITGLPIVIWSFGRTHVTLCPEGLKEQLYIGQWVASSPRSIPWSSIQEILLAPNQVPQKQQEIKLIRRKEHPLWLKNYYNQDQLLYIEQCLQLYLAHYQQQHPYELLEEGLDWSDHLIE